MSFWYLLEAFWHLLDASGDFFGPRHDSWLLSGPGRNKLRKSYNLVEICLPPGSQIWDNFGNFDDLLAACFLLFFWVPIFLTICSSGIHLGSNWRCFLGYLGPLEIGLKRWRGYDFHTLEVLFAGMVSRLDRVEVFFMIVDTFWLPFGKCFGTKRWKNGVWKNKRKSSRIFSCGLCGEFRAIPRLDPCGPLKEFKKSAISPGLAPATGNWQLVFSLETLPWCLAARWRILLYHLIILLY